jgi:hypothetical protein
MEGAMHSRNGQAVIALPSWHSKTDSSTVIAALTGPVTSFQHSALVTEHGCANIFGRSQRAQARLIIDEIAHPDARSSDKPQQRLVSPSSCGPGAGVTSERSATRRWLPSARAPRFSAGDAYLNALRPISQSQLWIRAW